jgi:aryl-alcohol dehydrogenase-like predicted oxidoreductase
LLRNLDDASAQESTRFVVLGHSNSVARRAANDFRQHLPRFAGDNLAKNQSLVDTLAQLAKRRGVTPAQLCIAWARAKWPFIVPLVGARTRAQLADALGAMSLELSADDIKSLEQALPSTAVAGSRYQEFQMKHLDSER